jgi:hypothetical protein
MPSIIISADNVATDPLSVAATVILPAFVNSMSETGPGFKPHPVQYLLIEDSTTAK